MKVFYDEDGRVLYTLSGGDTPSGSFIEIEQTDLGDLTDWWVNTSTLTLEPRPQIPEPLIDGHKLYFDPVPQGLRVRVYDDEFLGLEMTDGFTPIPQNLYLPEVGQFTVELEADFPYLPRTISQVFEGGADPILDETWLVVDIDPVARDQRLGEHRQYSQSLLKARMQEIYDHRSATRAFEEEVTLHRGVQSHAFLLDPNSSANIDRYPMIADGSSTFQMTMEDVALMWVSELNNLSTTLHGTLENYRVARGMMEDEDASVNGMNLIVNNFNEATEWLLW